MNYELPDKCLPPPPCRPFPVHYCKIAAEDAHTPSHTQLRHCPSPVARAIQAAQLPNSNIAIVNLGSLAARKSHGVRDLLEIPRPR